MRKHWPVTMLLVITLVGCSGGAGNTVAPTAQPPAATPTAAPPTLAPTVAATEAPTVAPTTAVTEAPTVAPPSGPPNLTGTTLTFWSSEGWPKAFHDSWAAFEKATGAKFDYIAVPNTFEDNFLAKWTGGDRPDLMGWHPSLGQLLKVQPETQLVDLTNEAFVAKTKFHMFDYAGAVNGKVVSAITAYPSFWGVLYNKDVFKRLGLTIPTSWDEMAAMCAPIKAADPKVTPIVAGGGAQWPLIVIYLAYIADEVKAGIEDGINDGTIKATDPRIVAGFQAVKDLQDKGCYEKDIATTQYEDQVSRVYEGKAAMAIQGTFMVPDMNDAYGAAKVNQTVGFFPISAKGHVIGWSTSQVGTYEVPVNKDPAKQAAALEFIRYVTGPAYQDYLDASGDLPVFEGFDIPSTVSPVMVDANKAFETDGVPSFGSKLKHPGYGDTGVDLNEMILGKKTALQVGEATQVKWETAEQATNP